MYTDIGLPHVGLDQLLAFIKEAYEIYPHGFIKIVLSTGESFRDCRNGGYLSYEYYMDAPVRNADNESPLERYRQSSNPNLYAAYKDSRFQNLCRNYGIEPVIDIPM